MDSISQIALGTAVSVAAMGRRTALWKAAAWGAVCGTLPDLDVLVDHGDALANMVMHRGDSHALFWLSLAALPLGAAIAALQRERALLWRWVLAAWLALVTHPLLDAMTIYGTQLLRPFSSEPLGLGSVFIIDPLYTLPLLIGTGIALRGKASALRWNAAGLLLSCAYLGWSALAQQQVLHTARASLQSEPRVERLMATPAPFNTLLWRVVAITPDSHLEGYHSLIAPGQPLRFTRHERGAALYETLREHPPVAALAAFSHGFFKLERSDRGEILMADLRMGQEPDYVFRFVVAREQSPLQLLDRPEAAGSRSETGPALRQLWRRLWGEPVSDAQLRR
jgi:inner membrane protein